MYPSRIKRREYGSRIVCFGFLMGSLSASSVAVAVAGQFHITTVRTVSTHVYPWTVEVEHAVLCTLEYQFRKT